MAQTLQFLNEDTTISAVCGEAFDAGAVVAIKPADGLLYKAGAAASTAGLVPCLGFAETEGEVGASVAVKTQGLMNWITATLTKGGYIYLGETLGTIQTTAPVGAGKRVQILGVAIDAAKFVIQIDPHTTL